MSPVDKELFDESFMKVLGLLSIVSRKALHAMDSGEARSPRKGGMVEFADHRRYTFGDDPRYVDWNLYARTGGLFVKEFDKEESFAVHALLDTSASMGFGTPPKWRVAARLATALSFVALASRNRVRLHLFSSEVERTSNELRGEDDIHQAMHFLSRVMPQGRTRISSALSQVTGVARHKALVLLFSDLLDEADPRVEVGRWVSAGADIAVFHILSPQEVAPRLSGRVGLRDSERGENLEMDVAAHDLDLYRQAVERYCDDWRAFSMRHEMHYFCVHTSMRIQDVVLKYLRSKGFSR